MTNPAPAPRSRETASRFTVLRRASRAALEVNRATGFAAPRAAARAYAYELLPADTETRAMARLLAASLMGSGRLAIDIPTIGEVWSDAAAMAAPSPVLLLHTRPRRAAEVGRRPRLPVEEARAVPIARVLDHLGIKRRGSKAARTIRISCPVHGGDGPNCSIDLHRGLWHCFVCDDGGDAISLVQRVRGLSFPDATREVAAC